MSVSKESESHSSSFSVRGAPESSDDLSADVVRTISRAPFERVTCRHVSGDRYRCNWWAPQNTDSYDNPAMNGLTVTTHRVSRSELLHVTRTEKGLCIKSAPGGQ